MKIGKTEWNKSLHVLYWNSKYAKSNKQLKTYSSLKPTCLTNPIPCSSTSSSQTAFTAFCLHRFFWANQFLFLVFLNFFVSVPFWQLLSARKYSVSYRDNH